MDLFAAIHSVNYLAILVAGVVTFALGMVWYSSMFSQAWSEDTGVSMNKPNGKNMTHVWSFIGQLLAVWVLAIIMQSATTTAQAVNYALFIGIFFIGGLALKNYLYEGRSCRLFMINAGYDIVVLVIAALILVAWK